MKNNSYTIIIEVDKTPEEVYNHICDVSKWWSKDFEGLSAKLNDEFTILHPGAHYSKQKLIEVKPGSKIVWLVTESCLDWLEKNKREWTNTKMVFEITAEGVKTLVRFTHDGLLPEMECYTRCSDGWDEVIRERLINFIAGKTKFKKMKSAFVYVSYIKTTREQLWHALTDQAMINQWWGGGLNIQCDWVAGSTWAMGYDDGRPAGSGEILEILPPERMVIKWRNESKAELKAEGYTRCEIELEQMNEAVKLKITHSIDLADSRFIEAVSGGWPLIISNLKSLLETGEVAMKEITNSYGKSGK